MMSKSETYDVMVIGYSAVATIGPAITFAFIADNDLAAHANNTVKTP